MATAQTWARRWRHALLIYALVASPSLTLAGSYEAALPAGLSTDPDLCARVACKDVLPAAESFSVRKGQPAYVEAYATAEGQKVLVGYVFLSTDVVDIPAYSGKPVVTLIGMDARGRITGVQILKHSEPILLVGIPESELTRFIRQFVGKFAEEKVEIGKARTEHGYVGIDAISGATVTVIAETQVVMRSAYAIAKQVGLISAVAKPQAQFTAAAEQLAWDALIDEGSVQRLALTSADLGLPETGTPYIDLYFGYLNAPGPGRSILGDEGYQRLMAELKPGEHAIFIVANGTGSFKGSAFVRGGIFDRIQVVQDADTFTFRDTDYQNLYGISAAGAPPFRESGIFIIRNAGFSAAYPWSLVFLANRLDKETGLKSFANFDQEYWLPARYLEGGRPAVVRTDPTWLRVWKGKELEVGVFALLIVVTATVYGLRDRFVRRATHKDKRWVTIPRYLIWAAAVGFAGLYALAQPSVTQVLTWFHSLIYHWKWELFLSDPLIFVFWWFVIITVFVWGRGVFCGWLCPYGALTEIAHKVAGAMGLKRFQFQLPASLHDRLKWIKYAVFAGLLAVSFYSMPMAEKMAEIEPFKSTFLVGGVWNRSWPFIAYWLLLFGAALFIERPFCKYLCPLGAALAVPTTFRNRGLRRKAECVSCHACQKGCTSLAIDDAGRIDQRECLLCLDCQILYYDDHACPPLAQERKRRAKAGQPRTPIGADGYFIPIMPVGVIAAPTVARMAAARAGIDARQRRHAGARFVPAPAAMPEHPLPGAASANLSVFPWLWEEAKFHLLPWGRTFQRDKWMLRAAEIGFAVVVTMAWILSGTGHVGPAVVIAWWSGWSVYEVICRGKHLPWIKDGLWWQRDFRPASLADIVAYVATKNLLIGAALFALLHSVGFLRLLSELSSLQWLH